MVPATAPPAPVAQRAGRAVGRRLSLRQAATPTRLWLAALVTVAAGVALALGGSYSVNRRSSAIDEAAAAARQLIRVQDVRVHLVQADSVAAQAYLQSGLEPATQRTLYDDEIKAAANGLIEASAQADATDAALLSEASASLNTYVGLVEQARANNRQGFPVGAAYQRQAHAEPLAATVATLRQVEAHARSRVDDRVARGHRAIWLFVLTALVALAVVVLGSVWLASRWRRIFNVPLVLAGLVVVVALIGGLAVASGAISDADDAVTSHLAAADLAAQARAAGFDARSNEALTLIFRGNGSQYEANWQTAASVVTQALDHVGGDAAGASGSWAQYADAHQSVRRLDDDQGNWDAAVALATTGKTSADPGAISPVSTFAEFGTATSKIVSDQSAAATSTFSSATSGLGALELLLVLAGLAVAVLGVAGYTQRIREYR